MDRLDAYETFLAIAREGSFTRAAQRRRQSPQAVTRAIAALEAHLEVRLFHRTTRAVSLTADGAQLLPRIERLLGELGDCERTLAGSQSEPHGELAVTAPVAFGRLHVLPVVTDLLARHRALDINLQLFDRNVRLVEEGIDVAVRIGALPDSSLRAVRIGAVRQVIAASPAYLARRGPPQSAQDLSGHDLIASTGPRGGSEWRVDGQAEPRGARRRLRVNSVSAALAAARAGLGLANFLSYQVAEALGSGELIEVLRPAAPQPIPIHLLFEPARANGAATRAFIEAMKQRGREGRFD